AKSALTVTIPGGAPTGQVFSGSTTDFIVSKDGFTAPSRFITVSDTGHLTGWAAAVTPPSPSRHAQPVAPPAGPVYTGLATGSNAAGSFLYAADFANGAIDVFDRSFAPTTLAGHFVDPGIPDDYAPFNIQNLAGKLYVTYAQREDAGGLPDKGHGFVSVFDTNGHFLNRLISHDHLKAPWGLALAPADFGPLSNALLVANHGDGRITAYDPATGAFLDRLRNPDGEPVKIDGLLGLSFGNGRNAGDLNALYFTAGPGGGAHGLLGSLRVPTLDLTGVEWRTIDGTNNNLALPGQGAAETRQIRFGYGAQFPDGFGDAILTAPQRANPRTISNTIHAQTGSVVNDRHLTDWAFQWGQWITHDLDLTNTGPAFNRLSTGAIVDFRIPVLDPNGPLGPTPIPFTRSEFDPLTGTPDPVPGPPPHLNRREVINSVTSYIDASMVYGSDPVRAAALRTFEGGALKTSAGGELLP